MDDQQKVKQIKKQHERRWLAINGVVAVGIGKVDNKMGIIISVSGELHKIRAEIPGQINGVPIEIQQTGTIEAQ